MHIITIIEYYSLCDLLLVTYALLFAVYCLQFAAYCLSCIICLLYHFSRTIHSYVLFEYYGLRSMMHPFLFLLGSMLMIVIDN